MKKILTIILSSLILCSATACGQSGNTQKDETTAAPAASSEPATKAEETTAPAEPLYTADEALKQPLEELAAADYCGVIYIEKDGKPLASLYNGTLSDKTAITLETPMPIGSVSKQFCAAAIMLLKEQGKLSVDDTLDKYYPEYKEGAKITLRQMLKMESGIPNLDPSVPYQEIYSYDKTAKENTESAFNWLFSQPLLFEPGSRYSYSNYNYTLLADIVEKVSGKVYVDFLRENIFEPLGMTSTGSVDELEGSRAPEWSKNFSYSRDDFSPPGNQPGISKGAGDIVSTARDMTAWMNALASGNAVSAESYSEMTADKETDDYGYGLNFNMGEGLGHFGSTGCYFACDYYNTGKKITYFMACTADGSKSPTDFFDEILPLIEKA